MSKLRFAPLGTFERDCVVVVVVVVLYHSLQMNLAQLCVCAAIELQSSTHTQTFGHKRLKNHQSISEHTPRAPHLTVARPQTTINQGGAASV